MNNRVVSIKNKDLVILLVSFSYSSNDLFIYLFLYLLDNETKGVVY